MKRLAPETVASWSDEHLVHEWSEFRWLVAAKGWKRWSDLPPAYRRNGEALQAEVTKRFAQLRLF
jgi:hypothetical protein